MYEQELSAYQDTAYAARFSAMVNKVRAAEVAVLGAAGNLTRSAADGLFRLMSYKDEYEVARLYTDGQFEAELRAEFDGVTEVDMHLAPPLLSRIDPASGRPRKLRFGGWMFSAMRVLARFKGLRGTPLDLFGYSAERRAERAWIDRYSAMLEMLATELTPARAETAERITDTAALIRGYGPVKAASMTRADAALNEALVQWNAVSAGSANTARAALG